MGKNYLYVFTYGTLMKGMPNHYHIHDSEFIGTGTLDGYEMYDYISLQSKRSYYPVIFMSDKRKSIRGELYKVEEEVIPMLDALESNGRLYNRTNVKVKLDNDNIVECVVYVGNSYIWRNEPLVKCPDKTMWTPKCYRK